jgi:hypothetical protein
VLFGDLRNDIADTVIILRAARGSTRALMPAGHPSHTTIGVLGAALAAAATACDGTATITAGVLTQALRQQLQSFVPSVRQRSSNMKLTPSFHPISAIAC